MSDKSGLKTMSLGLNTLGTEKSPKSLQCVHVFCFDLANGHGSLVSVSSERLEEL